jgi:hypothetical protein
MNIVWLESEIVRIPILRPNSENTWTQCPFTTGDALNISIKDAVILIVNKVKISLAEIDVAPRLKMI